MVPRGTRLYQRLKSEKRLLDAFSGDNTDLSLNFIPRMDKGTLISGYIKVLNTIYSPKLYYDRVKAFLKEYRPSKWKVSNLKAYQVFGGMNILWTLGFKEKGRRQYWSFLLTSLFNNPRSLPISIELAVYGYHFRKVTQAYQSPSQIVK